MAKTINNGYTDTPIEGVTALPFQRALVNFGADFRVRKNTGNEVILTNLTSPIDRPETIRFAWTETNNGYNNTDIDMSVRSASTKGVNLLVQLNETVSFGDDTDPDYRVDIPLKVNFTIGTVASEHMDVVQIERAISRLLSALFETGSSNHDRLKALLRGSLVPKDV